jgi:hypothetical protein
MVEKKKLKCFTRERNDGSPYTTCLGGQRGDKKPVKKRIKFKVKPATKAPAPKKIKFKVKPKAPAQKKIKFKVKAPAPAQKKIKFKVKAPAPKKIKFKVKAPAPASAPKRKKKKNIIFTTTYNLPQDKARMKRENPVDARHRNIGIIRS